VKGEYQTSVDIKVPFHDVDSYRVVWHGNYARYFEIARCQLLDELQANYRVMEDLGYFFPVVDMKSRFVRPLIFGQHIQVTASLISWRHKLRIDYRITDRETGQLMTRGTTIQVAISPEGDLQFQTPDAFRAAIEARIKST
jgi:acyl-CoA thioester hydrolase